MTLDDRIRSAVSAAHTAVQEVSMTQQQFDVVHGPGQDLPSRPASSPRWRVLATAAFVLVLVAAVAIPIMRQHAPAKTQPAASTAPTGRLFHPAILGGRGSFRVDPEAAIAMDSANVFLTRWSDIDDSSLYVVLPQLVVDPKSGAFEDVPVDLIAWILSNPRLRLGPPRSITVDGQLAVQFDDLGTVDGQQYMWMCPDVARLDCFDANAGGRGTLTVMDHNGSAYVIYGGASATAHQPIAISRTEQVLTTWRWGQ